MQDHGFQHVSDTALWVAAYRAQETARENPVFRDPFAALLAGERGRRLAESMPEAEALAFAMVVRTSAIDRLVSSAVAEGVRTIVNLGAGLDTRPYRLGLPPEVRWIEADFGALIDFKAEALKNDRPACRLERFRLDLSQAAERRRFLEGLQLGRAQALVITEGVLAYLSNADASGLAQDLATTSGITAWVLDYKRGALNRRSERRVSRSLGSTPFRFEAKDPVAFLAAHGWALDSNIGILDEADRIGKRLPMKRSVKLLASLAPGWVRSLGNRTYGYGLFRKLRS